MQFRLVNNHSERRAYIIAVITQNHCFAKRIQILRGLDSFPLLLFVTSHSAKEVSSFSVKTSSSYIATFEDKPNHTNFSLADP